MTDNRAPAVKVEGLTKIYGSGKSEVKALDNASIEVMENELVAVMGASGSGKSTLLHLVAGLAKPTAGTVRVEGEDLTGMSDRKLTLFRRKRIGLVFQSYNLIPSLSAEDNVILPLIMERGGKVDRDKLDELLETLGLKDRRSHKPDQLSGGERQRVAIGRALITDPAVILADEPTGNLDSVSSRGICELLMKLKGERGCTIMMVTHEPAVGAYSDRALVLRDGAIVSEIPSSDFADAGELGLKYQAVLNAGEVRS